MDSKQKWNSYSIQFCGGYKGHFYVNTDSFTQLRDSQDPSCPDLFFTVKEEFIDSINIGKKLGTSDHASIVFDVLCKFERNEVQQQRPGFLRQTTDQFTSIYEMLSGIKCQTWTQRTLGISL